MEQIIDVALGCKGIISNECYNSQAQHQSPFELILYCLGAVTILHSPQFIHEYTQYMECV